jgi:hypothetical protein
MKTKAMAPIGNANVSLARFARQWSAASSAFPPS